MTGQVQSVESNESNSSGWLKGKTSRFGTFAVVPASTRRPATND